MPTLQFKGQPLVQNHHLVVPFCELEAVKARGVGKSPSLHDHLIVEGDNLKALKGLLPVFHGKVKASASARPTTPATRAGFTTTRSTRR